MSSLQEHECSHTLPIITCIVPLRITFRELGYSVLCRTIGYRDCRGLNIAVRSGRRLGRLVTRVHNQKRMSWYGIATRPLRIASQ